MSDELAKLMETQTELQKFGDDVFEIVSKVGDFLPRLQLMTSNSDQCKDGSFQVNHYGLVKGKNIEDLGESIDILVLTFRPKAIEMGETTICVYDPKPINGRATGEFARIAEKSEIPNSGCMFGPEFLVWIPSTKEFATFFMGSKSARNESPNVKRLLGKAATLKSQKLQNSRFVWYSPLATPCSTPFELPGTAALAEVVQKFNNPPESEVEKVEPKETDRAR